MWINNIYKFYVNSQYSIIAPGVLQSNRKYTVSVSLHNATKSATMRVGIRQVLASQQSQMKILDTQEVSLQPFETKLLDLHPPRLRFRYIYELWAEGVEGIEFNEVYRIRSAIAGGPRIYIETDKGTYKSEDLVQFRVIILDEHLRPIHIKEPIKVQILVSIVQHVKII